MSAVRPYLSRAFTLAPARIHKQLYKYINSILFFFLLTLNEFRFTRKWVLNSKWYIFKKGNFYIMSQVIGLKTIVEKKIYPLNQTNP